MKETSAEQELEKLKKQRAELVEILDKGNTRWSDLEGSLTDYERGYRDAITLELKILKHFIAKQGGE